MKQEAIDSDFIAKDRWKSGADFKVHTLHPSPPESEGKDSENEDDSDDNVNVFMQNGEVVKETKSSKSSRSEDKKAQQERRRLRGLCTVRSVLNCKAILTYSPGHSAIHVCQNSTGPIRFTRIPRRLGIFVVHCDVHFHQL